jgi:hypothetical protein
MAWMNMQIVVGLKRLGHDVYYIEATSTWPFDPVRKSKVNDSEYALPYLARVAESFGLGDQWAYRRSYSDGLWFGPAGSKAASVLRDADAVLNVAGATQLRSEEKLEIGRLVYFGTGPGYDEVLYPQGDPVVGTIVDQHDDVVTYGENIGTPVCPLTPLPGLRTTTRQPVLTDLWESAPPTRPEFTTVCNWRQDGRDVSFAEETYFWSKHHEFLRFIDLPLRVDAPIELAMGLKEHGRARGDLVPALGMSEGERQLLDSNGWQLTDGHAFSLDPWPYRDYLRASRGEFTVAKDLNVRLNTGWFSERSACYLAAGRPVITQDTGFGQTLPTGQGLFAFDSMEELVSAFDAVQSDYDRHSNAARAIAEEYFRAEKVLADLLMDLG